MDEVVKPATRKRKSPAAKPQVTGSKNANSGADRSASETVSPSKLVWRYLPDSNEMVQIEVEA